MPLQILEFGSLFAYTPRPQTDEQKSSKTLTLMLKEDEYLTNPPILMSEFVARITGSEIQKLPFSRFFESRPVLVPIPRRYLTQPGTLWVPQRVAHALANKGLGQGVMECLQRVKPLPKAATSAPSERPKAYEHYDSMEVQKVLSEPREILLIDDVITRGATLLGAADRLADAFPKARIRAFAAIRTISSPSDFSGFYAPCKGTIQRIGNQTFRSP